MENYIEITDLPIIESDGKDNVLVIKENGEIYRGSYYTNNEIDTMIEKVRQDTVEIIKGANNILSTI